MTTCPVLAYTAETREVLRWFVATHEVDAIGMGVTWRQRRLPHEGAVADQDVWLTQALAFTRSVANTLLSERRAGNEAAARRKFHDEQVAARSRS